MHSAVAAVTASHCKAWRKRPGCMCEERSGQHADHHFASLPCWSAISSVLVFSSLSCSSLTGSRLSLWLCVTAPCPCRAVLSHPD